MPRVKIFSSKHCNELKGTLNWCPLPRGLHAESMKTCEFDVFRPSWAQIHRVKFRSSWNSFALCMFLFDALKIHLTSCDGTANLTCWFHCSQGVIFCSLNSCTLECISTFGAPQWKKKVLQRLVKLDVSFFFFDCCLSAELIWQVSSHFLLFGSLPACISEKKKKLKSTFVFVSVFANSKKKKSPINALSQSGTKTSIS